MRSTRRWWTGSRTVLTELDDDPEVRAVVLTGSPPGFCAGSDLTELAGLPVAERIRHEARAGYLARTLQQLSIPVVAAVEGFALGGGFLLATSCDIVVSADQARWQLPEVGLGWVPPWGLQSLLARVGPAAARRLAWGEQALSGQQVHQLGVVDEISEPGGALRPRDGASRPGWPPCRRTRSPRPSGRSPMPAPDRPKAWMPGPRGCSAWTAPPPPPSSASPGSPGPTGDQRR